MACAVPSAGSAIDSGGRAPNSSDCGLYWVHSLPGDCSKNNGKPVRCGKFSTTTSQSIGVSLLPRIALPSWINYVLLTVFVYAGMSLLSKLAIDHGMNPYVFVVYRQGIATLVIAPFAYFTERKNAPPLSFSLLCKIFCIALGGITLSLNLFNVALKNTTATLASASANSIPAITFIMAVTLRMEKISVKQSFGVAKLAGSVVCVSGAFVLALYKGPPLKSCHHCPSNQGDLHHVSDPHEAVSRVDLVKGSLLMLAANTTWSLWLILQGLLLQAYQAKVHLTALQCFFSCIQSAILAVILQKNSDSWKLGWDINLLSVLYCGVIVTGISYWLQIWCIEKKGPVFTAIFSPVSLLITIIFSAILWNEMLHWGSVGGGVLLLCGLYLVLWGKNKEVQLKTQVETVSSQKAENA